MDHLLYTKYIVYLEGHLMRQKEIQSYVKDVKLMEKEVGGVSISIIQRRLKLRFDGAKEVFDEFQKKNIKKTLHSK